jgi:hypothetical protein
MKKDEILSFTNKWMELENSFILSEVRQAQTKNHMFSLYMDLGKYSSVVGLGHTIRWEHTL